MFIEISDTTTINAQNIESIRPDGANPGQRFNIVMRSGQVHDVNRPGVKHVQGLIETNRYDNSLNDSLNLDLVDTRPSVVDPRPVSLSDIESFSYEPASETNIRVRLKTGEQLLFETSGIANGLDPILVLQQQINALQKGATSQARKTNSHSAPGVQ